MVNKVTRHLSEYVQNTSPLFVSFLELYYKFVSQRDQAVGLVESRHLDTDIDHTLDSYIDEFYATYGKDLGKTSVYDRRNLVKLLNDIYSAKGTEQSFRLLFLTLFGTDVTIDLPAKNILRSSDGKWVQELFFTVAKTYGSESDISSETDIVVSGSSGAFTFKPSKIVSVSDTSFRLYYPVSTLIDVKFGDTVQVYDSTGLISVQGTVELSPGSISINSGGSNFKSGQTFFITGSVTPTVFKIKSVDTEGKILSVSIIDHGYIHSEIESVRVTPYLSRPPEVTGFPSYDSGTSTWSVTLQDYVYGTSDELSLQNNSGTTTFKTGDIQSPVSFGNTQSLTVQEYLDSIAELSLVYQDVVKLEGKYVDNGGHLSDAYLRLQDNYYYQVFSYVVESALDISRYKGSVLKAVHPAGLKSFSRLVKTEEIDISGSIFADLTRTHNLEFFDTVTITDNASKTIILNKYDATNDEFLYAEHVYFPEDPIDVRLARFKDSEFSSLKAMFGDKEIIFNRYLGYFAEDYCEDTGIVDSAVNAGTMGIEFDTLMWNSDIVIMDIN